MPGKATQGEILSLQQQVNEQSDKGELISEKKVESVPRKVI